MHRAGLRGGIELLCPLQACHSPSTSLCSAAWKHPDAFLQRCEWRHHSSLFSHSVMSDFATPCAVEHQAPPSFTISLSLLILMSVVLMMPSNHFMLCHPLLLLHSVFPNINRVFSSESTLRIRWPKYWRFNFSISPSSEYSRLISFRIDWLISLQCRGLARVFPSTAVRCTVFK